GDDDDLIEPVQLLEHRGEEQALLRRSEPARRAGRENDRSDQDVTTLIVSITTGCDGAVRDVRARRP
ncbi:MAG: hypothetical protein M3R12_09195, partial [Actinomycetota bacterium]|nr:hypothetical protein [Actinomycetota bacterium]